MGDYALALPLPSLEHEIQNLFHEHTIAGAYGCDVGDMTVPGNLSQSRSGAELTDQAPIELGRGFVNPLGVELGNGDEYGYGRGFYIVQEPNFGPGTGLDVEVVSVVICGSAGVELQGRRAEHLDRDSRVAGCVQRSAAAP